MEDLKNKVIAECVAYAKAHNETNFEKIFAVVMEKRRNFYQTFFENFDENVNNINRALQKTK